MSKEELEDDYWTMRETDAINNSIENKKLKQRIAYLEEELADKELLERAVRACNRQNDEFADMIKKLVSEKEELKQQLTEKEEEIKQLNNRILLSQLQAPKEQILNIIGSSCCQYNPNQDKISFAVEQLEKVKEFVDNLDTPGVESICNEYMCNIEDYIDNQIKQLKEGK